MQKKSVNIISHSNEGLASHRMRCVIPCEGLNLLGEYEAAVTEQPNYSKDVNIFHKHLKPEENLYHALQIQDLSKIIFDVCDDHFDKQHGNYYRMMCSYAHVITCNTANMQQRIYEELGRLAQICSDPITFPYHEPSYSETPDIVWYGHATNVFSIVPFFDRVDRLTVITNVRLPFHDKVRTKFWKPGLVEETIHKYDVVVIPRINTPEANKKSPNRAVDALHAGRFVIAESEEVYGELAGFIFLGTIEEGIEFYKNNPDKVLEMIKKGQEYVLDKYNHKEIAQQWARAIEYEDFTHYG